MKLPDAWLVPVILLTLSTARAAQELTPTGVAPSTPYAEREVPLSVTLTPILGTDETLQPTALIADLDAGDLVAGRTWWEFEPDVVYVETFLGFLWTPEGGMRVFVVPLDLYFSQMLTAPNDIGADRTVVGTAIFTTTFVSFPFVWTIADGFEFLDTPPGWIGGAVDVSDDGSLIAGTLRSSLLAEPQAARWVDGELEILGLVGEHSTVVDGSDDGSVLVGDVGPDADSVQATRWVDGVEVGLAPVPGASTSSALHVSDDGSVVVGRALVGTQELLVHWDTGGAVTTFAPPGGLLLENVNAITPDGSAAVGALTDDHAWAQGNWLPYLWRLDTGFTPIDELGLPGAYDYSQAFDVSDDGTRVIGDLSSWVHGPGSEPPIAFLWTPEEGTRDLELVQKSAGGLDLGLYSTTAISGDGKRILARGTFELSPGDTHSVILAFEGL